MLPRIHPTGLIHLDRSYISVKELFKRSCWTAAM